MVEMNWHPQHRFQLNMPSARVREEIDSRCEHLVAASRVPVRPDDCYQTQFLGPDSLCPRAKSDDGRYWARTSDLRLVEAALSQLS
jgi:hypothetical protein